MIDFLKLGLIICSIGLFLGCTAPEAARSHEKAKMKLALAQTTLLVSEIAWNLDEPWEITWGGDNHLWLTEHKGLVKRLNPKTGKIKEVLHVPNLYIAPTPGLLSMVLHPDFETEPYVYVHYTYVDSTITEIDNLGRSSNARSRIARYRYFAEEDTLKNEEIILGNIPGSTHHNGSRMTVSSDKKLIFAIGDTGKRRDVHTKSTLVGKVLRLNLDGSVPDDNPVPGEYYYSMGHRNPQGLIEARGKIYASEHGPNNDDELNHIKPNANYGWPFVEGACDKENEMGYCKEHEVTEPIYSWTPTIAPAGLDYYDHEAIPEWKNSLMLTTLKGRSLQLLELDEDGESIISERFYLQKQFGRYRDLCVSPAGDVYLITSNSDWHINRYPWMYSNVPENGNDRVIKLSPIKAGEFADLPMIKEDSAQIQLFVQQKTNNSIPGARSYVKNCAPCHLPRGQGIANSIPPLVDTEYVNDRKRLIETTLNGLNGEITVNGKTYDGMMPGFSVSLNDKEMAEVLNYVIVTLNEFQDDQIKVSEVQEIRKQLGL